MVPLRCAAASVTWKLEGLHGGAETWAGVRCQMGGKRLTDPFA